MAGALRTIEFQVGLDPQGVDSTPIPFAIIEQIALARVAEAQLVEQLGTELMYKIYTSRRVGVTSPKEVAETFGITLRGAQTWIGRLDQLLARISDDGN